MAIKFELNEAEYKNVVGCLDVCLRAQGLSVLEPIVNLYNILMKAEQESKKEATKGDEKKNKKD